MKIKDRLILVCQAVLITYALQMEFSPLAGIGDYKSAMHYLFAQVTSLLGEYSFSGLLLFAVLIIFLLRVRKYADEKKYSGWCLPCFFSFCLLMGESYVLAGSWSLCFGDVFHIVKFLLALAGYAILFRYLIMLFWALYQKAACSEWKPEKAGAFLGEKCFRNVFFLLMLIWLPVILLSYPANVCYDGLGQIEQVLGRIPYSSHHPLLHTLIMGGIVKAGKLVTGSYDIGLFVYILLQAAALAAALAGTVARMTARGVSFVLRILVLCVYVFAPMYSNMVSTAVKDVPFMAAVIWYILLLEEMTAEGISEKKAGFWIKLIFVQVLAGLLRNNGIYMVVLTGVVYALAWGKKTENRKRLRLLFCMALLPLLLYKGGNELLVHATAAERGSVAEMLSIPFQQTARYLQLYRGELSEEEKAAIEGVLADVDTVAGNYDPDSSDAVKMLYQKDAGLKDMAAYFKVWFACFWKHPAVYIEAFFIHVYGWFDPGVANAIRYEAESDLFRHGLFSGADKMLVFWYRFLEFIPPLALLENVGAYTWMLFLLAREAVRKRERKGMLLVPLFVSLLICMASPCFYLHPRYAYPIMFTIPFLYGIISA